MRLPKHARLAVAAGFIVLVAWGLGPWLLQSSPDSDPSKGKPLRSADNRGGRVPSTPVGKPPSPPRAPQRSASEATRSATKYFHDRLESRPAVDRLYRSVRSRLPSGEASELLAVYVSEAIARNGSREFAQFMRDLHHGLSDNSQDLFTLIQSHDSVLKEDPFIYQMTLNLAAHLDLPGEQKAQLLGGAMSIHFEADSKTGISAMSTNITNALILMKNYGITATQAAPYIQSGIAVNRDDPQALAEFAARANTYYPGSVTGP